jgi:Protein of unknown function (DUF3551)
MRQFLLVTLCAAGVFALSGSIAPVAAASRYCLQGSGWGHPGNCRFATYSQCMATASGTRARCGINPRYAFARQRREPRY